MIAVIIILIDMRIPPRSSAQRTCRVDGAEGPLTVSVIHGLPAENPQRVWSCWSGFLILRGTGTWEADGAAEAPLASGCFGQHPLGTWHRVRRDRPQAWAEVSLRCPRTLYLHLVAIGILPAEIGVQHPADPAVLLAALLRLKGLLADRRVPLADCLAQVAVAGAAMQRAAPMAQPAGGLAQARRDLADDVMAAIDLRDYAHRLGWSYAHFRRAFTRATGAPPAAWRTRHRLEHARRLLAEQGMAVGAVAEAVGYGSTAAFSRSFARAFAASPSGRAR